MGNIDLRLPGLGGGHIRTNKRLYRNREGGGGGLVVTPTELADAIDALTWLEVVAPETLTATDLSDYGGAYVSGTTQAVEGEAVYRMPNTGTTGDALNTDGSSDPTFRESVAGLNSRAGIEFGSTVEERITGNSLGTVTSQPYFIVTTAYVDPSSWPESNASRGLISGQENANGTYIFWREPTHSTTPNMIHIDTGDVAVFPVAQAPGDAVTIAWIVDAGSSRFWMNGIEYDVSGFTGTNGMNPIRLGSNPAATGGVAGTMTNGFAGRGNGTPNEADLITLMDKLGGYYGTHNIVHPMWESQTNNEGWLFGGVDSTQDLYLADAAKLDITGSLEIWVEYDHQVQNAANESNTLVGKWGQDNSYWFGIDTAGMLNFWTRETGTLTYRESTSTAAPTKGMVRVAYDHDLDTVIFWEKESADEEWTQVGTAMTHGMAGVAINSTSDDLMIGNHYLGDAEELAGVVRQVRVYDGVGTTRSLVAEMKAEDYSGSGSTFTSGGDTWNVSSVMEQGYLDATAVAAAEYNYPFPVTVSLDSAAPLHGITANDDTLITGTTSVTSVTNIGTAGGTWTDGSNDPPELLTNGIGNRPCFELDTTTTNGEALHTSATNDPGADFTWLLVHDYDNTGVHLFWGTSENAASNTAQLWESGATNLNLNSGVTRTDSGSSFDQNREVMWGVCGDNTTHWQAVDGQVGQLLGAGSTGTGGSDGFCIGSNGVPDLSNTYNGRQALFLVWGGDFGNTNHGASSNADNDEFTTLIQRLRLFYNLMGT